MHEEKVLSPSDIPEGARFKGYRDYVVQNPKFLRPEELPYLKGDSTKIRTELGWKPKYSFEMLMNEMTDEWLKIYKEK